MSMSEQFTTPQPVDQDSVMAWLAEQGDSAVPKVSEEMHEEIVLVAFKVNAKSNLHAQTHVMASLANVRNEDGQGITEWWIAEDERFDRTDAMSAIFVPKGTQAPLQTFINELVATGGAKDTRGGDSAE